MLFLAINFEFADDSVATWLPCCDDVKTLDFGLFKKYFGLENCQVMEELAYFVTKTFEYNNTTNRVLEIINMTTKFDEKSENSEGKVADESMDEDESVDIEITDNCEPIVKKPQTTIESEKVENCDKSNVSDKAPPATKGIIERTASPLPLIKKLNRDGTKHVTKNWLISDCPKRKAESKLPEISSETARSFENQENSAINLIRVEDLVNKKHSTVRAKPVNELLKQIREINNQSPFHNTNENFKVEMEDDRVKAGELEGNLIFVNPFFTPRSLSHESIKSKATRETTRNTCRSKLIKLN